MVIDGGERIVGVDVQWAYAATALPAAEAYLAVDLEEPDHVLVVRTAERGDFSRYRLALVAAPGSDDPPSGFDPLLAEVMFSFKVECPSDFDCKEECECPPQTHTAPTIDYLAKDFQGFRRIMLERMALLAPGWTERNAADVGVTLVELMAYIGDELSYRQDAVATEAYLGTARSRISLRRLARLVDYRMHDGCNARAWVQVRVHAPAVILPQGTTLLSKVPGLPPLIAPDSPDHHTARDAHPVVFETVEEAVLDQDLNEMRLWTWGDLDCCLPAGATTPRCAGITRRYAPATSSSSPKPSLPQRERPQMRIRVSASRCAWSTSATAPTRRGRCSPAEPPTSPTYAGATRTRCRLRCA